MSGTSTPGRPAARLRRWAANLALAVVVLGFAAGAMAVGSGNYQVRPVLTGSMTPGLPVGGVVVTQRVPTAALNVRDVIVFAKPGGAGALVVHRIIDLKRADGQLQVRTQGDANPAPDPWTASLRGATAYRAVGAVPFVGYVSVWAHAPQVRTAGMVGAGFLCLIACLVTLRRPGRREDATPMVRKKASPLGLGGD